VARDCAFRDLIAPPDLYLRQRAADRRSQRWSAAVRWLRLSMLATGMAAAFAGHAAALDFPTHTVRIVVPFQAGGVPDVLARILAQGLSEKWGQPVIVENRAGGNTNLGATFVSRSAPDGYTMLFTTDGTFILNPILYSTLPYSMNDLAPVTMVATSAHAFAVNKDVPVNSVQEFVALAKKKPNELSYGSTGPGSIQRIAMEAFSRTEGLSMLHVPYKGSGETMTALLAGQITATINGAFNILPLKAGGTIKALAITTTSRSRFAPDLPTMQEAGVPGFSSQGISGMFVPAQVPTEIRDKIHGDIVQLLQRADVKQALDQNYFESQGKNAAEFRKVIEDEGKKWRQVITAANIKIE
jgi:tripartite-type tricarboxylate transporter receptor subunit TctC